MSDKKSYDVGLEILGAQPSIRRGAVSRSAPSRKAAAPSKKAVAAAISRGALQPTRLDTRGGTISSDHLATPPQMVYTGRRPSSEERAAIARALGLAPQQVTAEPPPPAAAPSPPPSGGGSGGGGGGGGGGAGEEEGGGGAGAGGGGEAPAAGDMEPSDAGAAEAVRQFREAGVDPFEEEGAAEPSPEDAAPEAEGQARDEEVSGFELTERDIFLPHEAMMRYYEEKQAEAEKAYRAPSFKAVGSAKPLPADPVKAKRAALAQKRMAELQRRAAVFDAQQRAAVESPVAAPVAPVADSGYSAGINAMVQESVMGDGDDIEFEEVADIFVVPYESQITDAEADPVRGRASKHSAVAYLDPNYPPHGSSGGREGGMMKKPEFEVEVLGAYDSGVAILGAVPAIRKVENIVSKQAQKVGFSKGAAAVAGKAAAAKASVGKRAGFVKVKTPGGRIISSLRVSPKNDPEVTIRNAKDVAARAKKIAAQLDALAKKRAKAPVPVAKTKVKGEDVEIFGLVMEDGAVELFGVASKSLPRGKVPRLSAARIKKIADSLAKTGSAVGKSGKAFESFHKTDKRRVSSALKKVASDTKRGIYKPLGKTSVRGDEFFGVDDEDLVFVDGIVFTQSEVLGAYCQALSEEVCGVMGVGAMQALASSGAGAAAAAAVAETPPADEAAADPVSAGEGDNYGLGPPPTEAPPLVEGVDFIRDPGYSSDQSVYSSDNSIQGTVEIPVGAVYYDGSQPLPWQGVGSFSRFWATSPANTEARSKAHSGGFDNNVALATALSFGIPVLTGSADVGGYGNSGFQLGGGNPTIMDGWYWWWEGATSGTQYKRDEPGGGTGLSAPRPMLDRAKLSSAWGWGPLVGNPRAADAPSDAGKPLSGAPEWTRGLRYDIAANNGEGGWFWYYDMAPDWAKLPGKIARLNKAVQDYKNELTARKLEAAEKVLADQLEQKESEAQAKQQAKDDAATQRRYEQEQKEAEHKAAIQTIEDERLQKQQSAADEAALSVEEKRAKMQEERELRMMQAAEEAALSATQEAAAEEAPSSEEAPEAAAEEAPAEAAFEEAPASEEAPAVEEAPAAEESEL